MAAHGIRLFLLEALLFSALLLLPARPSAADGSTYPADCPYPCLPPPTAPAVTADCPPPPASPSSTYSYPPPPPAPSSYNTPPSSSWSYPPPSGGYIPYFQPPAGGGGGGGYGYPAPPPPNPILPWYPWYYKTPPSSAAATLARGSRIVLGSVAVLAAVLLIMA
jgi:hypothetical protein